MDETIVQGGINSKILSLRVKQVMLDRDLAELYCVMPRRLREQAKRNIKRFPSDFMFQLSENEIEVMVSQNAIPSKQHLSGALPYVFTEQGICMLATVFKSDVAIDVKNCYNAYIHKTPRIFKHYNALAKQLIEIGRKHDKQYKELKKALDELIVSSEVLDIVRMGF